MVNFKFEKEYNRWYVVLPEWTEGKDDLEMVLGADTMLDILSQGENEIDVCISLEPFDGYRFKLDFDFEDGGGAWYHLQNSENFDFKYDFDVWLCKVTIFVFGSLPKNIYVK